MVPPHHPRSPKLLRRFLGYLLHYWQSGGWRLVTETQCAYVSYFFRILSECLLAAVLGSWLGSNYERKTRDIFNMCKVFSIAFFFLPTYRDSRQMHWRQHTALVIASFALAFGRVPAWPKFIDTYDFGLRLLPAVGIASLAWFKIDTYVKLRFNFAVWAAIFISLFAGCPIFVNVLECVTFSQYVSDSWTVALQYAIGVEIIIILYIGNWHQTAWLILVPLFFQTGGWNIFYRMFFGFLFIGLTHWLCTSPNLSIEETIPVIMFLVFGSIFYLIYMLAVALMPDPPDARRVKTAQQ